MTDEITVSIDGENIGTTNDVKVTEIISPDTIVALREAFQQINETLLAFGSAVSEAFENVNNPNHETVMRIMDNKCKSKEEKLPKKLRNGWK